MTGKGHKHSPARYGTPPEHKHATCAASKKEKPQFVVFLRFKPEREGERSSHVPPSPARPDTSSRRPPLRRGTALVHRPPGGAVGDVAFLDAWRKVAAPNIDPTKTPLAFMKPRPPTPSSVPSKLTVNFGLPCRFEISNKEVDMVIVPATTGQLGVSLDMLPPLQRLKPGVLPVHEGNEVTKNFVSSGFAFTHANSVTDIVAVEAVPVDHIDPSLVQKGLADYTQKLNSATTDLEMAEGQIGIDVHGALDAALSGYFSREVITFQY
ncbi:unnamed protein product [Musa hybrid cultivar]